MRNAVIPAWIFLLVGCGGSSTPASSQAGAETAGAEEEEMMMEEQASAKTAEGANIVETAQAAGQFGTLLAAVEAAGLAETLSSPGPFTLFAPTDAAFAALPEGTVENLLLPENKEQLVAVLTYHVVSGDVRAEQVMNMESAQSLQGGSLPIQASDDGVRVGEATVVQADVEASNGVIHVIDRVLLPPSGE